MLRTSTLSVMVLAHSQNSVHPGKMLRFPLFGPHQKKKISLAEVRMFFQISAAPQADIHHCNHTVTSHLAQNTVIP